MSGTLERLGQKDLIQRARDIAAWSEDERRRFAAQAANERDLNDLWAITYSYLTFHSQARGGLSPHTMRSYRKGVAQLVAAWSGENLLRPSSNAGTIYVDALMDIGRVRDPRDPTPERMTERELERRRAMDYGLSDSNGARGRPLSPASVRSRIQAARALFAGLNWTKATTARPFDGVKLPMRREDSGARIREKAYTDEELEAMLGLAEATIEDRVLVHLGAHGGLRVSEMLALRWEDVHNPPGKIRVRAGKGGKAGHVRMSATLSSCLDEWSHEGGVTPKSRVLLHKTQAQVFERLETLWRQAFPGREFEKGVHGLRHYTGVRLYLQTGNLKKVKDHLRHASLDMALVYADAADDTEEVGEW
ncbi:MAG: site-specific integrase [Trueperaceae bacterium]